MVLSLQRLLNVPRRIGRTLIAANQYHSRSFLSTEPIPTSEEDDRSDLTKSTEDETDAALSDQQDFSHYLSEKPVTEHGRKMRIYMPARSAGTQGVAKVGMWKVEPENPRKRWGNPLMGWTSTRDPLQSINHGLERFATREAAEQWCESNGMHPKTTISQSDWLPVLCRV